MSKPCGCSDGLLCFTHAAERMGDMYFTPYEQKRQQIDAALAKYMTVPADSTERDPVDYIQDLIDQAVELAKGEGENTSERNKL